MKKFWNNLPFFWKVYLSAILLILSVVFVAECSEDLIPYITNYKRMNQAELEKLLDEYIESDDRHAEWHDEMKKQGIWLLDIPLSALGGWVDMSDGKHEFSVLEFLPDSDDWTDDWIIVEKILPDGRLVAMGLDEPIYSDFMDAVLWMLVIALFAGLACYWLSKFLTSRLSNISAATRQLADGDLTARVPVDSEGGDELATLGRLFNRMVESVERVVENERRLLYDISHELRSPLARMNLSLDLVRRLDRDKSEKYLELLQNDIERMTMLMDAIMEQGKSHSALDEILDDFDLSDLVREITELANFEFHKSSKNVECVLVGNLPEKFMFSGSRSLIEQALYNLLSNALRYTPAGSKVEVGARIINVPPVSHGKTEPGQEIVITVRDYGPGVPEGSLPSLFRPFFRVESARDQNSGGTGLGLALVQQYVKRHGWHVSAHNANPGLAVHIVLPV